MLTDPIYEYECIKLNNLKLFISCHVSKKKHFLYIHPSIKMKHLNPTKKKLYNLMTFQFNNTKQIFDDVRVRRY